MLSSALLPTSSPPPSGVLAQVNTHNHSMTSGFSLSSVKEKLAKQLDKCNEGQVSMYDEDIVVLRYNEQMPFLEILNIPHDCLPLKIPKVNGQVTLETFVQVANALAKSMRDECECCLLYLAPLPTFNPTYRFCQSRPPSVQVHRIAISHWPHYSH